MIRLALLALALAFSATSSGPARASDEKSANCSELPSGTTSWNRSASGCKIPATPESSPHAAKPMKGWELYSWRDAGEWRYSLLSGTNRMKSAAELKVSALRDLDEAEKKIRALPAGAEIFWNLPGAADHLSESLKLERPPRNSQESRKIRGLAKKLRLKLTD